jgi:hypothetical protein
MTPEEKHINSTLRVIIKDVKENTTDNKDCIIMRLKHCLHLVETKF